MGIHMKELVLSKVENAFGIKKLRVNINNDNKMYQELIYSKNGTFKTSFSKMLYELNRNNIDNIFDRLTEEKANINISLLEDKNESFDLSDKFIIFSREIYDNSSKQLTAYETELESLTLNKEDSEYIGQLITEGTNELKDSVESYLKDIKIDFEKLLELITDKNKGYLDRVIELLETLMNTQDQDISEINMRKLFQKAYDIIEQPEFKEKISNYISVLEKKVNLELFDNSFNEVNCFSFIENLAKTNYLNKEKQRGIFIKGNIYYNIDEIQKIFKDEVEKISKDPEIIEQSKEITKTIGKSKEAEILKKSLQENPLLVKQLSLGRIGILKVYLRHSNINFNYWLDIAKSAKKELKRVLLNAKNKKTKFEKAISIYKERFHPVFDIKIINKEESLLGLEFPTIAFFHNRCSSKEIEEGNLNNILSSGEKTTLNILKFIVEYETIKQNKPFIILDDIVETFDYSNRYGFIEYINDLVKGDNPIIVLTHNFEFFNNVSKRIKNIRKSVAISDNNGFVTIQVDKKISKNIETILKCNTKYEFIAAIPYLREAKKILDENTDILNSCLHYKHNTMKIKIKDLIPYFPHNNLCLDENKFYFEELTSIANDMHNFDNFDIVKKTVLAIACRLTIEKKIIGDKYEIVENVNSNQTVYLLDNYAKKLTSTARSCLEEVQLSTPEFIHGNAFMYEPLIDIDGKYLEDLYRKIYSLNDENIWL